jgi:formylglycine-generating enzyme required for sulfatase activity
MRFLWLCVPAVFLSLSSLATDPLVSNVTAHQIPATGDLNICYDLSAPDRTNVTVSLTISVDGGTTWFAPNTSYVSGAVGLVPVSPESGKTILWEAWRELPEGVYTSLVARVVAADALASPYMVVDLSGGAQASSYPVASMDAAPIGGWTDEHKTAKLVLRRIPMGTYTMGSPVGEVGRSSDEVQHSVTLTNDFYIGVFEVSQRQWELVMGNRPSYFTNSLYYSTRPVECISYYDVREDPANTPISPNWPSSAQTGTNSFMGRLRTRTGLNSFDLPTEAQWEYACRAGTTTALNSGKNLDNINNSANLSEVGRYAYNGGVGADRAAATNTGTAALGSYLPNAWGLYDMHGNVWEWTLDWYGGYTGTATNPPGPVSGTTREARGGCTDNGAGACRSANRCLGNHSPVNRSLSVGCRAAFSQASALSCLVTGQSGVAICDLSPMYRAVGCTVQPVGQTAALQIDTDNSGDGGTSIRLGGVGLLADNASVGFEYVVEGPGILAFDWRVSSEAGYDELRFYDASGGPTTRISGTGGSWQRVFVTLDGEPGHTHTLRWEYAKDTSDYVGQDAGWVDAISWTPLYHLNVTDGSGSGYYTNHQEVAISAGAPPTGHVFARWIGATQYVADALSPSTTLAMPASSAAVAATFQLDALSGAGGVPVVPAGNTSCVLTSSSQSSGDGTSIQLGQAGLLDDGDRAGIEFSVTGNGVLAFDWQVSSEEGYDWLRFYEVGAGPTNQISGTEAGWSRVFVSVVGETNAVRTFRWEYVKDPIGDFVGSDCGWVDAVSWAPYHALSVNAGSGSGLYTNGMPVAVSADAPEPHYAFSHWEGDTNHLANAAAPNTVLTMPAEDTAVAAVYAPLLYTLSVTNGSGSGTYPFGTLVGICATAYPDRDFYRWTGDVAGVADAASPSTTVTIAGQPIALAATYSAVLTVTGGSGGGRYPEGVTVAVAANPDPLYMEFAVWEGSGAALSAQPEERRTTLVMPPYAVALSASYRNSIARAAGCYGRTFATSGVAEGLSTDLASGSPSSTGAVKLGGAGVVPDNGFAAFETVVSGSGQISFWWRVSSESNADFLKFLADGSTVASISGTKGPWAQVSYRVEGAGESHTLRWEYAKNASLASSTDAGWVDDILWEGDVPVPALTPDIRKAVATNHVFALTFQGERGIPYTIYSNASPGASGWASTGLSPQSSGETNGVFQFKAFFAPPVGQRSGFYRVIGGE